MSSSSSTISLKTFTRIAQASTQSERSESASASRESTCISIFILMSLASQYEASGRGKAESLSCISPPAIASSPAPAPRRAKRFKNPSSQPRLSLRIDISRSLPSALISFRCSFSIAYSTYARGSRASSTTALQPSAPDRRSAPRRLCPNTMRCFPSPRSNTGASRTPKFSMERRSRSSVRHRLIL